MTEALICEQFEQNAYERGGQETRPRGQPTRSSGDHKIKNKQRKIPRSFREERNFDLSGRAGGTQILTIWLLAEVFRPMVT